MPERPARRRDGRRHGRRIGGGERGQYRDRRAASRRDRPARQREFRNTGGTAAHSGTVTFATHIIGALGIDWATVRSTQPLPAPIGAGAVRKKTYTVCVDAWRVPLGVRIETQDVTAVWK